MTLEEFLSLDIGELRIVAAEALSDEDTKGGLVEPSDVLRVEKADLEDRGNVKVTMCHGSVLFFDYAPAVEEELELDFMTKPELVQIAKEEGVDPSGKKPELLSRLYDHFAATTIDSADEHDSTGGDDGTSEDD